MNTGRGSFSAPRSISSLTSSSVGFWVSLFPALLSWLSSPLSSPARSLSSSAYAEMKFMDRVEKLKESESHDTLAGFRVNYTHMKNLLLL